MSNNRASTVLSFGFKYSMSDLIRDISYA